MLLRLKKVNFLRTAMMEMMLSKRRLKVLNSEFKQHSVRALLLSALNAINQGSKIPIVFISDATYVLHHGAIAAVELGNPWLILRSAVGVAMLSIRV
jgi:hypothetical protein